MSFNALSLKVQIQHRNFIECIRSLVGIDLFTFKDTMVQMASCSYDVHVQEVIGALIVGSSIVMLRSQANIDLEYVLSVLNEKQVSYMQSVPTYLSHMINILPKYDYSQIRTLRTLDIGGKWHLKKRENVLPLFCRRS